MDFLALQEAGSYSGIALSTTQARWLIEQEIAKVQPSSKPGCFDLQVSNIAGIVAFGDLLVDIQPKLPVRSLLWLLSYSETGLEWREETVELAHERLSENMISLLCTSIDRATRLGTLKGYWQKEDSLPYLRGRIRTSDQFNQHYGLLYPLEVSFDEYSSNIPENRILLSALREAEILLAHTKSQEVLKQLYSLLPRFAQVQPLSPGQSLPSSQATRLSSSYQQALKLADLFLSKQGINTSIGATQAHGFLINMPQLFEDFVTEALKRQTGHFKVTDQAQTRFTSSNLGTNRMLRPDITVFHNNQVRLAIDVKYKQANPTMADLYQLNAYADTLNLDDVTLVYGEKTEHQVLTTEAGKRIHLRGLDLSAEPQQILEEISRLLPQPS